MLKMLDLKIWLFCAFLSFSLSCGFGVEFKPCSPAKENLPCNMTCITQDISQQIDINCNGSSRGSCFSTICSGKMYQLGSNTTYYTIDSLSYANHLCDWSCKYGSTNSNIEKVTIISNYTGQPKIDSPNTEKGQVDVENVQLEATADCFYPSTEQVNVLYRYQDGKFQTLENQDVSKSYSFVPGMCDFDIKKRITVTSDISGKREEMKGKTVYFKIRFLQYATDNSPKDTTEIGPFTFEGCSFSVGGFSVCFIEPAAFIAIMILLMLKRIGGITLLKVCVSCGFLVAALIIGLILGFVLKECDKQNLSLGLGLGLGFLLAAAHLVTIYVIHKKMAPPKINVPSRFKKISTFEKGEPVVIKIPFTGNPKPKVKWVRDGVELKGRKYVQEVTERHAILTIKEANKEDDGQYRLILENELGTDSADIKIQVNDDDGRKGTPASTSNVEFTE